MFALYLVSVVRYACFLSFEVSETFGANIDPKEKLVCLRVSIEYKSRITLTS